MRATRLMLLGACALAVACQKGIPEEEVAARVNGEPITKAEFQQQVERNMSRYRGQNRQLPASIETRIRESVLRRMIDDKMIAQKAEELGLGVTEKGLNEKLEDYKGRFRTEKAFQDYLERSKNTEANMKTDLERSMLRDRVIEHLTGEVEVSDEEVAKYFEENKPRFVEREQVKVSHIMLRVPPQATDAQKKEVEQQAKALSQKAKKKGADFAALAKEHSQGPNAKRGGEMGWRARGAAPAQWDAAVFALEAGEVSEPIKTQSGFEVVKVWEKRPERQRELEEVSDNIRNSLLARRRNEKRREILRELKSKAKVEMLITFAPPKPTAPRGAQAQPQEGAKEVSGPRGTERGPQHLPPRPVKPVVQAPKPKGAVKAPAKPQPSAPEETPKH